MAVEGMMNKYRYFHNLKEVQLICRAKKRYPELNIASAVASYWISTNTTDLGITTEVVVNINDWYINLNVDQKNYLHYLIRDAIIQAVENEDLQREENFNYQLDFKATT